ncbi:MAG: hypothetical protein ACYDH3_02760 [Candidatus Aminicenantales bacterium]
MLDLINLLEDKERRTVTILAAVFGGLFLVFLIFGVRARLDAGRMAARRAGIEASYAASDLSRKSVNEEWARWTQAETDIDELRQTWFYDYSRGIRPMRKDLDTVLKEAGVAATDLAYGEADVVKDRLRRVTIGFNWQGTYPAFRHLLETIEAHPRALQVVKIAFNDVGGGPGFVQAGITLEGYSVYE